MMVQLGPKRQSCVGRLTVCGLGSLPPTHVLITGSSPALQSRCTWHLASAGGKALQDYAVVLLIVSGKFLGREANSKGFLTGWDPRFKTLSTQTSSHRRGCIQICRSAQ